MSFNLENLIAKAVDIKEHIAKNIDKGENNVIREKPINYSPNVNRIDENNRMNNEFDSIMENSQEEIRKRYFEKRKKELNEQSIIKSNTNQLFSEKESDTSKKIINEYASISKKEIENIIWETSIKTAKATTKLLLEDIDVDVDDATIKVIIDDKILYCSVEKIKRIKK